MAGDDSKVVVIGGGAVGTACAYYLARAGDEVTLVERSGLGAEASGANLGLLLVSDKPPGPLFELSLESARLYGNLAAELDYQVQYERSGSLLVYTSPDAMAGAEARAADLRSRGLEAEVLGRAETRRLEPALHPGVAGSLWCNLDGTIYPFALCHGYARAALRHGARVLTHTAATALEAEGGRVTAVVTDRGRIRTEAVVLAAGAWSPALAATVGVRLPIEPSRGQMLVTEPVPPMVRHVIMGHEPYVRQSPYGQLLIGSIPERVGFNKATEVPVLAEFAAGAIGLMPCLGGVPVIRSWAGLRPRAEDQVPIIGEAPGVRGLFVAAGHFRNGMGQAPATGAAIAELIRGRPGYPWLEAFDPGRFA